MIKVMLVDDHALFRAGLHKVLTTAKSIDVVGQVASGEEAVEECRRTTPDVVLMDICMPGIGGLEATRRITRMETGIHVVMLTGCREEPSTQALKAGACGYVTKFVSLDELTTAVRRAFVGKRYVSTDVAQLLAFKSFQPTERSPFDQLSNREMQITLMVINCHRVQEISTNLHLSPKTVNSYRYRIFDKLGVSSDVALTLMAVKHGMINPRTGGDAALGPFSALPPRSAGPASRSGEQRLPAA